MNRFIGWMGEKKLLRKEIVSRFPENFDRYIEVFGGAAWVLFHSEKHAGLEVYNDYNSDQDNLYRCIKYYCQELQRQISFMLNSRELLEDFKAQYCTRGLTDIQRAARFIMVIKTSYGSNADTYACVKKDIAVTIEYLNRIQERLSRVAVENKDFESFIKFYDRPAALFYLDPPYYGTEKYYQAQFCQEDHERLYRTLKGIKGKFILSYNYCDYIWERYENFHIEAIERNNSLVNRSADKGKQYGEVIIRNY